ncbi:unnamed protein product [Pleuronectes platessa]|uniref:Uncharacterized protein n=1 Tax=Pleuronectes platessa TaxID=8262 RepID=A0A9N7VL52_PLEPL|nr:unnamed protein product [Pleuronectes platessa]
MRRALPAGLREGDSGSCSCDYRCVFVIPKSISPLGAYHVAAEPFWPNAKDTSDGEKPEQGAAFCFSHTHHSRTFIILQASQRDRKGRQRAASSPRPVKSTAAPGDLKEALGHRWQRQPQEDRQTNESGETEPGGGTLKERGRKVEATSCARQCQAERLEPYGHPEGGGNLPSLTTAQLTN